MGLNAINFLMIRLPPPTPRAQRPATRPMLLIARQPVFIAAVASAALGYSVMVLLMTATPLEMMHLHQRLRKRRIRYPVARARHVRTIFFLPGT